jgi:hypothetical protein
VRRIKGMAKKESLWRNVEEEVQKESGRVRRKETGMG